jgi:HEAT repeat protein
LFGKTFSNLIIVRRRCLPYRTTICHACVMQVSSLQRVINCVQFMKSKFTVPANRHSFFLTKDGTKFALPTHRKLVFNSAVNAMRKSKQTMRLCIILVSIHLCSPAGITAVDNGIELQREKRYQEDRRSESESDSFKFLTQTRLGELIRGLCSEEKAMREQAISELVPHRNTAGPAVLETLIDGKTDSRSAALEVLNAWHAPTSGINAADRATITLERVQRLDDWVYSYSETSERTADEIPVGVAKRTKEIIEQLLEKPKVDAELLVELVENREFSIHIISNALKQKTLNKNSLSKLRGISYWLKAGSKLRSEHREKLIELGSEDSQSRQKAFEQLSSHFSPYDRRVLMDLFSHADEQLRIAAIEQLKHFDPLRTKVILSKLLNAENDSVRAATVNSLEETESFNLLKELEELIESESNEEILANALSKYRIIKIGTTNLDSEVNSKLLRLLMRLAEHRNAKVRRYAGLMLCDSVQFRILEDKLEDNLKLQIWAALNELCVDPDAEVASMAFRSFRPKPTAESCRLLKRIIQSHPSNAKEYVESLDLGLPLSDSDRKKLTDKCLVPMFTEFLCDDNAHLRITGLHGLLRHGDDELLNHLDQMLQDKDRTVRLNAMRVLAIKSQGKRPVWVARDDYAGPHRSLWERIIKSSYNNVMAFLARVNSKLRGCFNNPFDGRTFTVEKHAERKTDEIPPLYQEIWVEHSNMLQRSRIQFKALVPILKKIAVTDDAEESQWAALCLIFMGHWETGLPVFMECQQYHLNYHLPRFRIQWRFFDCIPFQERTELLRKLVELDQDFLPEFPVLFARVRNHRATDVLWELVESGKVDIKVAAEAIASAGLGKTNALEQFDEKVNKDLLNYLRSQVEIKLQSNNERARVTAALIAGTWFPEFRGEIKNAYDECTGMDNRLLMLETMFPSQRNSDWEKAIGLVKSNDEAAACHVMWLSALPRLVSLLGYGKDYPLESELNVRLVRPYLQSDDIRVRAYATYWMIQLGENVSLAPLHEYWQSVADNTTSMIEGYVSCMLADAAAKRNDPLLDSVAQAIYEKHMQHEDAHSWSGFYWAIRPMVGPNAMAIRAQMRKRYGGQLFERR